MSVSFPYLLQSYSSFRTEVSRHEEILHALKTLPIILSRGGGEFYQNTGEHINFLGRGREEIPTPLPSGNSLVNPLSPPAHYLKNIQVKVTSEKNLLVARRIS